MADDDVLDIAPGGDVVLICAPSDKADVPYRLRVSSAVLNLASPVFRALLGPKFREGTALASHGYVEVPLPDDAAEPMITILKVMHMDGNIIGSVPDVASLVLVANLVDKYDCTAAIAYSAYFWLSRASQKSVPTEYPQLLTAAYLLRQGDLFTQFGRRLIMESESTILAPEEAKLAGIEEIFVCSERERQRMIMQIFGLVEERVSLEAGDSHSLNDTGCAVNRGCTYGALRTKVLIRSLRNAQVWPSNKFMAKAKAVQTAIQAVRTLDYQCLDKLSPCGPSCCGTRMPKASMIRSTNAVNMNFVEQGLLLFCVECARAGAMKPKKNCEHEVDKKA